MLLLTIDRKSRTPAYRQIIDAVVRLVDGGTLAPGDRLPPLAGAGPLGRPPSLHRHPGLRGPVGARLPREPARLLRTFRMTPSDAVRRCFEAVLHEDGGRALQYGEPAGSRLLRETLAQRQRTHAPARAY